jgi:acid stress-induced BolA-like protein IbaG/YrbA
MSDHPTDFVGSIPDAIRDAIVGAIAGADVHVEGGGGHYTLAVTSPAFAGKGMIECHRMVYGAIAHLMKGDAAPVHAIDRLVTRAA